MQYIVLIWVVYFLFRWLTSRGKDAPAGAARTNIGAAIGYFQARGKVAGHKGPGARSFKGRAGRQEWWLGTIWNGVVGAVIAALSPTIGVLLSAPWIIASLALNSRRLHDLRKSAWLQLLPIALGLAVGAVFAIVGLDTLSQAISDRATMPFWDAVLLVLFGVALVGYLAFYGWLGIARGDVGPNYYGEADA